MMRWLLQTSYLAKQHKTNDWVTEQNAEYDNTQKVVILENKL